MKPWEETAPPDDSPRPSLLAAAASPQCTHSSGQAAEELFATDVASLMPAADPARLWHGAGGGSALAARPPRLKGGWDGALRETWARIGGKGV